jgi:signal transduction histidine kinase
LSVDIEHELRTPLTAIIAGLCLLSDHAEDLTPEHQRAIILRSLARAKSLAGTVDRVIVKETGGMPSSMGTWALEELVSIAEAEGPTSPSSAS